MSDTTILASSPRSALRDGLTRVAIAMLALALVGGLAALVSYFGAPGEAVPASRHPFAAGASEAVPSASGMGGAILAIQSGFYARMLAALQAFPSGAAAVWTLVALSFAYGVFHAAGPGHGKAVISGYLVADGRRSIGRGLGLAFASSVLQALSAIAIVGVLSVLLGATAAAVNATARVIEQASFALVAIVGLVVLWRKTGRLAALMRAPPADALAGLAFQPSVQAGSGRFRAEAVEAGDVAACNDPACGVGGLCGHVHMLTPAELTRIDSLRDMAAVALSAGIRPCSGAIIVLVFAFSRGMPAAGVAATLAMALGTFITVGALASLAVFAKRLATRLAANSAGDGSRAGARAIAALEVLAGAVVAAIGFVLVMG